MTFYERYINSQTIEVYEDISALGQNAFLPIHLTDIEKVLTETFQRVSCNLDIIYVELVKINYLFKTEFKYNFERPLHKPLTNTTALLERLDTLTKPLGFVPLSLKFFYKIVGGVNFVWDYDTNDQFMWEMADPIQIRSLDDLVSEIQEYNDTGCLDEASLYLSADDLHKDNISGGEGYAIEITNAPVVDSMFLNEPGETTFINYLRTCFNNCGFPGITRPDMNNDYQNFFDRVKPKLKPI